MNGGLNYLQTFNPAETKAELLEHTLIGRKDLVDLLEELVIESLKGGNRFQRLIIGPRGSGKTHLLKVLHNRIFNNPQLKGEIEIAYLVEDEYGVATFLDWIIRILRSFIRWYPEKADHLKKEIEKLKKVYDDDKEKLALKILLDHIKERTLLIIVENIGNIFHKNKGFGKKGQQKFRDLIQQYPSFTIISSNQALFEDIQKEDMPFHNFFKIFHLKKLNLAETILFLRTIAEREKNIALLKFLDTAEGRGRITAIYDLVGGNHRLLVTFYNFLKSDFINKLSASFTKTINDLIPYYQSLMGQLSAQQQKIVQYLCQIRIPSNVKNIAENCFSAPNTISKQLINLVRLKYINSVESTGRETFYELSEPLLRICHEVKENRGGPIKLFIDFLGNLYTAEEIKRKFMHYHILATTKDDHAIQDCLQEQIYYKETLKSYFPKVLESDKFVKFETSKNEYKIPKLVKLNPDNYFSYINIVTCQIGLNNISEALIWLKRALEKAVKNKLINELIEGFEENLTTLFIFASEKNIVRYLQDALILIKKYNYLDQFYKSNPSTIFAILREYNSIETEKFDFIFEYINKQFKDVESMIVPLKFLDIGIRYLKKKEKNVLMQFTKEERATFKKFVLDNEYHQKS